MDELDLRVRRPMKPVDPAKLESISTFAGAISECAGMSRLQDKSIAIETGTDPGLWSRIKSGDAGVKGEFLERLFDACGNELPLLWLLSRRGYDISSLRRRETLLEIQLRQEQDRRASVERELETIKRFMRETKAG